MPISGLEEALEMVGRMRCPRMDERNGQAALSPLQGCWVAEEQETSARGRGSAAGLLELESRCWNWCGGAGERT